MDLGLLMTPAFSKDILCHVWPDCSKRYIEERDGGREGGGEREREREREGGRGRWVDLGHLMTPGLGKDIRCHVGRMIQKEGIIEGRDDLDRRTL